MDDIISKSPVELFNCKDFTCHKPLKVYLFPDKIELKKKLIIEGSVVIPHEHNAIVFSDYLGNPFVMNIRKLKSDDEMKEYTIFSYEDFLSSIPKHITKLSYPIINKYNSKNNLLLNLPQHIEHLSVNLILYPDSTHPTLDNLPSSLKVLELFVCSRGNYLLIEYDEKLNEGDYFLFKPKLKLPFGCELIIRNVDDGKNTIYNNLDTIYFKSNERFEYMN